MTEQARTGHGRGQLVDKLANALASFRRPRCHVEPRKDFQLRLKVSSQGHRLSAESLAAESELANAVSTSAAAFPGRARTAHRRGQFPVRRTLQRVAQFPRAEEELCTAVHSFGAVEESP